MGWPDDDDILDPAPRDLFYAWAIGVVGAVALAVYGAICIYTRSATWVGDSDVGAPEMPCEGKLAIAVGILWIATASLIHFHFFWSWREKFHGYAQIGKVLSLLGMAGGLMYFIFRFWLA